MVILELILHHEMFSWSLFPDISFLSSKAHAIMYMPNFKTLKYKIKNQRILKVKKMKHSTNKQEDSWRKCNSRMNIMILFQFLKISRTQNWNTEKFYFLKLLVIENFKIWKKTSRGSRFFFSFWNFQCHTPPTQITSNHYQVTW